MTPFRGGHLAMNDPLRGEHWAMAHLAGEHWSMNDPLRGGALGNGPFGLFYSRNFLMRRYMVSPPPGLSLCEILDKPLCTSEIIMLTKESEDKCVGTNLSLITVNVNFTGGDFTQVLRFVRKVFRPDVTGPSWTGHKR